MIIINTNIIGWKSLFHSPQGIVLFTKFTDWYPIRRFGADEDESGQNQGQLKFIMHPELLNSPFTSLVMWSYFGKDTYEYMKTKVSKRMKSVNGMRVRGRDTILILTILGPVFLHDGKEERVSTIDVSDMKSRCTMYQRGSPSGTFPLPSLAIASNQLHDYCLNPKELTERKDQEKLTEELKKKKIPDNYFILSRGLTGKENLTGISFFHNNNIILIN